MFVTFNKLNVYPCWCSTTEYVKKQWPHFHCPMCKHCFQRKSCFKKHIRGRFKQDNSSEISQTEVQVGNAIGKQTENRAASPDINHINETDETSTIAERKDSVDSRKELTQHKCPYCGKFMLKRNIPRDCRAGV